MDAEQHSQLLRSRWEDFRSRCSGQPKLHPPSSVDPERYTIFRAAEKERERKVEDYKMSKEEVLHHLRTQREGEHRARIHAGFEYYAFCWNSKPAHSPCRDAKALFERASVLNMSQTYFHDFFELSNKSVPLYVLTSPRKHNNLAHECLQKSLGCYLYDKWFRPYKTDIDFNQFIAKIIVPMDLECQDTRPSAALVNDIAEINRVISSYIKLAKRHLNRER